MFSSDTILANKGTLAKVWLAAHWERKLSKSQFLQTNIQSSVRKNHHVKSHCGSTQKHARMIDAILKTSAEPMALRLSGQLLLGVVRIFSRKARYLLEDCNEALIKIKMAFRPGMVDLPEGQTTASFTTITLGDNITELDMLLPEPVLDLKSLMMDISSSQNISRAKDITMPGTPLALEKSRRAASIDPLADLNQMGRGDPGFDLSQDFGGPSMGIEVGRDAADPLQFNPMDVSGTLLDQSRSGGDLLKDVSSQRLSFAPELPGGNVSLDLADDPLAGGGDIDFGLDFNAAIENDGNFIAPAAEPDFQFEDNMPTYDDEPERQAEDEYDNNKENEESLIPTLAAPVEPATKKAASGPVNRKTAQLRKRRFAMDEELELRKEVMSAALSDTRDICVPERYLPPTIVGVAAERVMKLGANFFLDNSVMPRAFPVGFECLFEANHESLSRFKRLPLPLPDAGESSRDQSVMSHTGEFRMGGEEEEPRLGVPIDDDDNGPSLMDLPHGDDAYGNEYDGGNGFQFDEVMPNFDDLQADGPVDESFATHQQKKQRTDNEEPPAPLNYNPDLPSFVQEESVVLDDPSMAGQEKVDSAGSRRESVLHSYFEDEEEPHNTSTTGARAMTDKGFSKSTLQTIRLLKDGIHETGAKTFHFEQVTANGSKPEVARFFFELLVLKTKNLIDVKQETPFGDIKIVPRSNLESLTI